MRLNRKRPKSFNREILLYILLAVIIFALGISIAYMTHTRNELQTAYEDLVASKTELEGEYEALGNTYSDLLGEYSSLEAEKEKLSGNYDKLKGDYKTLQADYDAVQEEIDNYIDQQATINDLNSSMTAVNDRYDELFQDYIVLQKQVNAQKAAEAQAEKEALQQSSSSGTVYITPSGECYHRSTCSTIKNSKNVSSVSVSAAKARGLRACKVCNP
ncbi:MAG: hypothetical protein LIO44_04805 [Eubacterium sp.]|nr:hypothetical protein [Eubacterium sp.]